MSTLTHIEKEYFEELFGMKSGYVMDFSNAEFARFFKDTVSNDLYDMDYEEDGGSKANRMRSWWEQESDKEIRTALEAMLDKWAFGEEKNEKNLGNNKIYNKCREIVNRLHGKAVKAETKNDFLSKDFGDVHFDRVKIEGSLIPILEERLLEAKKALEADAPLSVIFMCGSILEGLLLGVAQSNPKAFNQCEISPKNGDNKVKSFNDWSLNQFKDVACNLGYLNIDVQKFSHALRDFRNYIHPYQQMQSGFAPDKETAKICLQVLRAAVVSLQSKPD